MSFPGVSPSESDRPAAEAQPSPVPPVADTAPPIAPASPEQSPWWSAPAGKPFGIPDFAHEFIASFFALLASLYYVPQPIPVRVKPRRR